MRFGIYTSGRVKSNFASLLIDNGINISAVYCDDFQKCVESAVGLGCRACYSVGELVGKSDAVVISVEDEHIRKAVLKLAREDMSEKAICVESSCAVADVLLEVDAAGHLSIHVPGGDFVYVEGMGTGYRQVREYIESIGAKVIKISPDAKESYDLAMFFAECGISTVIETARQLMGDMGGADNFKNIIQANVDKSISRGEVTGVVPDYDISAIRRQVDCLSGNNEAVYKTLVLKAVEFADLSADEKDRIKSIIIGR